MTKENLREEMIGIKRGYHVKHETIIYQALDELKEPYQTRLKEYYVSNKPIEELCKIYSFSKQSYLNLINESLVALEIKLQEWGA